MTIDTDKIFGWVKGHLLWLMPFIFAVLSWGSCKRSGHCEEKVDPMFYWYQAFSVLCDMGLVVALLIVLGIFYTDILDKKYGGKNDR